MKNFNIEKNNDSAEKKQISEFNLADYGDMPLKYVIPGGVDLFKAAKNMIEISENKNVDVFADLHGTKIEVKKGSNPDFRDVVDAYLVEDDKKTIEHQKNSKEYQLMREENREVFEEQQAETNKLIKELPNIDWNNKEAVLDWLRKFNRYGFVAGIGFYPDDIFEIFGSHGYHQCFAKEEYLDEENEDRLAKHIVGKVLENVHFYNPAVRNISRGIDFEIEEWKSKFGKQA